MELFKDIDAKETKLRAKRVLSTYRRLSRIAGQDEINLRSPIITDMPRTPSSYTNKSEDATCIRVDAENELKAINAALSRVSRISREVISMTFCENEKLTAFAIGLEIGYSERSIKDLKAQALLEFADVYRDGKLIVKK
ncbi:ArpU family phage packaging/lysis transcriptional regulator [Enterococcus avium]|uniref:ArpU family phage packaging/lysis transcriptional regulator n=1 Tax=Enterococcus avium TaxID=33945 RepID=UPI000F4FB3C3|nr:ArpU family phage packaging/lysis transcriptional regulator [Enterococcus avium]MDT2491642.1 ArpU family phage packaging/lysis transcriptional regulator [Enterococcus avium]ROZ27430.1 ArpU family transcriptional regulator [Enterococcus avium]